MHQFEIQGDIEARVSSQNVCQLHRLWMRFHAAASDLPTYADLSPEHLQWCAANLMVVEPVGDADFLYRYHGAGLAPCAQGKDAGQLLQSAEAALDRARATGRGQMRRAAT